MTVLFGAGIPAQSGTQHAIALATAIWGTTETELAGFTTDHTGYWWILATAFINAGGAGQTTFRIRNQQSGAVIASQAQNNTAGASIQPLIGAVPGSLFTSGQRIQFTAQSSSAATSVNANSYLYCGFIPDPSYPG